MLLCKYAELCCLLICVVVRVVRPFCCIEWQPAAHNFVVRHGQHLPTNKPVKPSNLFLLFYLYK